MCSLKIRIPCGEPVRRVVRTFSVDQSKSGPTEVLLRENQDLFGLIGLSCTDERQAEDSQHSSYHHCNPPRTMGAMPSPFERIGNSRA